MFVDPSLVCCSNQHCSKWPPFRIPWHESSGSIASGFKSNLRGTWCAITQIIPITFYVKVLWWCYTGRFATTIFSATHRCNAGTMFCVRCQRSMVCSFFRHWCPKDIPYIDLALGEKSKGVGIACVASRGISGNAVVFWRRSSFAARFAWWLRHQGSPSAQEFCKLRRLGRAKRIHFWRNSLG